MTLEEQLNALRAKTEVKEEVPTDPTLKAMNELAIEIAVLRDQEKELADAKKKITDQLEVKEQQVLEFLLQNNLTSYKSPVGLLSISSRTSVKQPQGEQVLAWLGYLTQRCGSLDQAVADGLLSTNSMRLNSLYKEELELSRERGEDTFNIPGLTEVKVVPTLSFRRTR